MHFGQYVFTQIASFLPKRYFERLVVKSCDRTKNWTPSPWSQLLVLMFGQLMGCKGLRELTDITTAHAKKSFHLVTGGDWYLSFLLCLCHTPVPASYTLSFGRQSYLIFRVICVYFASKFDKNANLEIKIYKIV